MYLSVYDTPMGSKLVIDDIKEAITKSLIMGNMEVKIENDFYYSKTGILLVNQNNKEVRPFDHPISIIRGNDKYLAIDVRRSTKLVNAGNLSIINRSDFNLHFMRAKLQKLFETNPRQLLSRGGVFPMLTYSRWVSETLGKVLGLSADDQFKICAIAGIYFLGLFQEEPMNEADMKKAGILVSRATRIPVSYINECAEKIGALESTDHLVAAIIGCLMSPRLENFTVGSLYAYMSNGWLSSMYKPVVAAAVDHVPTWMTLSYLAINDKGATRTAIGKLIQNNAKGNNPQSFILAITSLMSK